MNKKKAVLGRVRAIKQTRTAQQQPGMGLSAANILTSIQTKFKRLKEIRTKITGLHDLYREHDALMEELLPLFIKVTPNSFVVTKEITIGTTTYRFNPSFYDVKKMRLTSKNWKAAAHPSGWIE